MNPAWIPALCAVFGLLVNAIWTGVNMQMRSELAREFYRFEESMAQKYVSEKVCAERMGRQPLVAVPAR